MMKKILLVLFVFLLSISFALAQVVGSTLVINGQQYEIKQELGKGGFKTAYKAVAVRCPTTCPDVTVGVFHSKDGVAESPLLGRINNSKSTFVQSEFNGVTKLTPPGGTSVDLNVSISIYAEGDLNGVIYPKKKGQPPLSLKARRILAEQLYGGLREMESIEGGPVINTDIKPGNIQLYGEMTSEAIEAGNTKLVIADHDSLVNPGYEGPMAYTRTYIPPEVVPEESKFISKNFIGNKNVAWSAAMSIYELATGEQYPWVNVEEKQKMWRDIYNDTNVINYKDKVEKFRAQLKEVQNERLDKIWNSKGKQKPAELTAEFKKINDTVQEKFDGLIGEKNKELLSLDPSSRDYRAKKELITKEILELERLKAMVLNGLTQNPAARDLDPRKIYADNGLDPPDISGDEVYKSGSKTAFNPNLRPPDTSLDNSDVLKGLAPKKDPSFDRTKVDTKPAGAEARIEFATTADTDSLEAERKSTLPDSRTPSHNIKPGDRTIHVELPSSLDDTILDTAPNPASNCQIFIDTKKFGDFLNRQ